MSTAFTEHLADLLSHSVKLDAGNICTDDFVRLQRLGAKIIDDYTGKKYGSKDKHALYDVFKHCEKEYRLLLKLD